MKVLFIIIFIVLISYGLFIIGLIKGWRKIKIFKNGLNRPFSFFTSLVISIRNEASNIEQLLNSIKNQSLSKKSFELILIDDASSDKSLELIKKYNYSGLNVKTISINKHYGKKKALQKGINKAKGQLIVLTDADCVLPKNWLKTLAEYYAVYQPKMILAPVIMKGNSPFEKIQSLDFFSLMISGAAATGISKPILSNGANLAFEKKIFKEFEDPFFSKTISGDDVFLLLNIKKKYKNKIHFLKSNDATVNIPAKKQLKNFINQRKRWASKSKYYKDTDLIFTSVVVLAINTLLLVLFIICVFSFKLMIIFILVFLIKSILDYSFLKQTIQFFNQENKLKFFFQTQLFNIVFVPLIAISSWFSKIKWS